MELEELALSGSITRLINPSYYREKNIWLKIGESGERQRKGL